jgi:hypothetical protein
MRFNITHLWAKPYKSEHKSILGARVSDYRQESSPIHPVPPTLSTHTTEGAVPPDQLADPAPSRAARLWTPFPPTSDNMISGSHE